jgi:hypothetical protein
MENAAGFCFAASFFILAEAKRLFATGGHCQQSTVLVAPYRDFKFLTGAGGSNPRAQMSGTGDFNPVDRKYDIIPQDSP